MTFRASDVVIGCGEFGNGFGSGTVDGAGYGSAAGLSGGGYGEGFFDGYGYGDYETHYAVSAAEARDGSGTSEGLDSGYGEVIGAIGAHDVTYYPAWQYIRVGCQAHALAWWRDNWAECAAEHGIDVHTAMRKACVAELLGAVSEIENNNKWRTR